MFMYGIRMQASKNTLKYTILMMWYSSELALVRDDIAQEKMNKTNIDSRLACYHYIAVCVGGKMVKTKR